MIHLGLKEISVLGLGFNSIIKHFEYNKKQENEPSHRGMRKVGKGQTI